MKITLSNEILNSIDTNRVGYLSADMAQWFYRPSGQEHYRLLMHIADSYEDVQFADIGTFRGSSAIALSQNPKNKVTSIDVGVYHEQITIDNLEFRVGNFQTDKDIQEIILKSPFVFLDIDHMYHNEIWFYNFLKDNNWRGLMLCDDIYLNNEMKKFWQEISHPKIDITKYGHFSGTGAVIFDESIILNLT